MQIGVLRDLLMLALLVVSLFAVMLLLAATRRGSR
jgi:hypothetical protein